MDLLVHIRGFRLSSFLRCVDKQPVSVILVSVRLYSLWDEDASRISLVFTDEGFVEVVFEKPEAPHPRALCDVHQRSHQTQAALVG